MENALAPIGDDIALPEPFGAAPPSLPSGFGAPRVLSKKQKAAIIVRLLLSEGVDLPLSAMSDETQENLTMQMSAMRFVDRATLKAVVDEFVGEIEDVGLAFPGGLEGALSVLEGAISPATAARLRKQGGVRHTGDPWETIAGLDPLRLLPVLEEESVEIAAVLLSKLKVSTAAELLGKLPGPRARRVAYAVSLTGSIEPEVVDKIGRSLAEQLDAQPMKAFEEGPVERVGAILNFSPAATRDEVLDGLDQDDAMFAAEVRKAIFTFANIPQRLDPRDIPKVTKDLDQAVLITALAAATGDMAVTADFILGAMSKRMADQIREEMENLGTVKAKDGEEAMNAVVGTIRELEAAGEVLLIAEDE